MASPSRSPRVALTLLGLGAIALLVSTSLTWVTAANSVAGGAISLDGATCLPAGRAVAVLALASVGGILATRGTIRRVIGVVVVLAAGATLVVLLLRVADGFAAVAGAALPTSLDGSAAVVVSRSMLGPILAIGGILAVTLGGVLTVASAGQSRGLGDRFERAPDEAAGPPSEESDVSAAALWSALDRGEDPTET